MTPLVFVLLALAGGVGAVCRFLLDGAVRARTSGRFPIGTVLINVSGSLVLGLLAGLDTAAVIPDGLKLVAGTGFLGGYTTFSTASFETVRLAQERRWAASALNGLGTLLMAIAAALGGYLLGRAL